MCFSITVSLNAALEFVVSRNERLPKVVLKAAYTWESAGVQQVPRQVWVQCLCIADKVVALLILNPLHIYLLCTRGVVVAGVNSSATCRMWCIYTFGVCFVPGITFKYPQWDTHAQIFCRNSWVTRSTICLSQSVSGRHKRPDSKSEWALQGASATALVPSQLHLQQW